MRRVIRKTVRRSGDGVDLVADINAEIAVNVGRSRSTSTASARVPEDERPAEPQQTDDEERKEP